MKHVFYGKIYVRKITLKSYENKALFWSKPHGQKPAFNIN